jgi:hypothetical protein
LIASFTKELVPADNARTNECFQWGGKKVEEKREELRKRKKEIAARFLAAARQHQPQQPTGSQDPE